MMGSSSGGSWRVLQHWVNTLPPDSCALVSSVEDLRDGSVLCDIVATIEGEWTTLLKFRDVQPGLAKLRLLLCHLGEQYGYSRLPQVLSTWEAADMLHEGDRGTFVGLLHFLRAIHDKKEPWLQKLTEDKILAMKRQETSSLPERKKQSHDAAGQQQHPPPAVEVREAVKSLKGKRGSRAGQCIRRRPAPAAAATAGGGRGGKDDKKRQENGVDERRVISALEAEVERERTALEHHLSAAAAQVESVESELRPKSRPRRRPAGAAAPSSSVSMLERPGWNQSTALEEERDKKKGKRAVREEQEEADEAIRQAGRLDEDFTFVRGLKLQTMYDPTYRPPPGFVGNESRQPIVNVRLGGGGAAARDRACSPDHRAGVSLTRMLQEGARTPGRMAGSRGPQQQQQQQQGQEQVRVSFGHLVGGVQRVGRQQQKQQKPVEEEEGVVCQASSGLDDKVNVRPDTPEGRRKILFWVKGLGVRVCKEWLPKCETAVDLSRRSLEGGGLRGIGKQQWKEADDLMNGVTLCELAAALEARSDAAKARADLRFTDNRFLLPGTTTHPRCFAQVLHNVERALEVFRRIPREINSRHLHAASQIAKGDQQVLWFLLGDLYDAFHVADPQNARPDRLNKSQADAAATSSSPFRHRQSSLLLLGSPGRYQSPQRLARSVDDQLRRSREEAFRCSVEDPRHSAPQPTTLAAATTRTSQGGMWAGQRCESSVVVETGFTDCSRGLASPARAADDDHVPRRSPPRRVRKRAPSLDGPPTMPLCFTERPSEPPPPVTSQQERLIREWLHSLALDVSPPYHSSEAPHCLEDPLRNGLFLCNLFTALEPEAACHAKVNRLVHRRPTSLRHVQDNVARALWLFKLRRCPPIPARYLSDPDGVIHGEQSLVWGLLWHIRRAYMQGDHQPPLTVEEERRVVEGLGYTVAQKRQLERSLVVWLEGLSVLEDDSYGEQLKDLYPLEPILRDGTLLCRLAERLTGRHVPGWIRLPRIKEVGQRNVGKAVDALRRWPAMSRRHLCQGVEEGLMAGDWVIMLGVLEDMHRAADGLPPRPMLREDDETPYLGGRRFLPAAPMSPGMPGALLSVSPYLVPPPPYSSPTRAAEDDDMVWYGDESSSMMMMMMMMGGVDEGPREIDPMGRDRHSDIVPHGSDPWCDATHAGKDEVEEAEEEGDGPTLYDVHEEQRREGRFGLLQAREGETDLLPFGAKDDVGRTEDLVPQAWPVDDSPPRYYLPSRGREERDVVMAPAEEEEEEEDGGHRDVDEIAAFLSTELAATSPRACTSPEAAQVNMESFISESGSSAEEDDDDDEEGMQQAPSAAGQQQDERTGAASEKEVQELVSWLESLGIRLREPSALLTPQAPEFSDGLVLATLVEKLEMGRGGLQGIDQKPKARATRLQNIKRVMTVLKGKQAIPLHLLHMEFSILEGETCTLVPLLQHIRKAYGRLRRPAVRQTPQIPTLLSSSS